MKWKTKVHLAIHNIHTLMPKIFINSPVWRWQNKAWLKKLSCETGPQDRSRGIWTKNHATCLQAINLYPYGMTRWLDTLNKNRVKSYQNFIYSKYIICWNLVFYWALFSCFFSSHKTNRLTFVPRGINYPFFRVFHHQVLTVFAWVVRDLRRWRTGFNLRVLWNLD